MIEGPTIAAAEGTPSPFHRLLTRVGRPLCALALAVSALLLASESASSSDWRVDYGQSRLGFSGTQGGSPFEGVFAAYTAEIRFDADNLADSRAAVTIETASARTGNPPRDATMREPDWLDVARFPQARFEADAFRKVGSDIYEADGKLTIRDVTQPVVLPFRLTAEDGVVHAEGALTINRTDYGIGRGSWATDDMVGFPVTIRLLLVASPAP